MGFFDFSINDVATIVKDRREWRVAIAFCAALRYYICGGNMKRGLLAVNAFLNTEKFLSVYRFLQQAAEKRGIALDIVRTDEFCTPFDELPHGVVDADFVIFWDKDVHAARRLERAGMKVFNSARTIEICDSKILTAMCLDGKADMPTTVFAPKTFDTVGYSDRRFVERAAEALGLPMVVKEACGSFGWEVWLARSLEEANAVIDKIGAREFLMQKFVAESAGQDVRVNIVGGKVVSAMYRYNDRDFRSNITLGGKMKPYELSDEQRRAALAASEAVGADFCGVDLLFGGAGPLVCEVNSNPNFKSSLDCTGVNMADKIVEYIEERI